jgi:hypothetical protein
MSQPGETMNFDEALMAIFPQVKRIRRQFMTSDLIIMLEDGKEYDVIIPTEAMRFGLKGQAEAVEYYAKQIEKKLKSVLPEVIDTRNEEVVK